MRLQVNAWPACVQAWLWPPTCIVCGGAGQPPLLDLCHGCAADLIRATHSCRRCALPVPEEALSCGRCLHRPPAFDRAIVPFTYAWPVDRLLHSFKYGGQLAVGRVLGTLLANEIRRAGGAMPERIIPVPLHPRRQRERGFNQAAEFARELHRVLRIPVDQGLCRRIRDTRDQTELTARQRRRNLRKAFSASNPLGFRHVAMVDDVMTTGSTTHSLALALKVSGVEIVDVWAVARAARARSGPSALLPEHASFTMGRQGR